MINILILTYNRTDAVQASLLALHRSIIFAKKKYHIHIFDDGSDEVSYNLIISYALTIFQKKSVSFHRNELNTGYNKNFKKVVEFLEHLDTVSNSITYIHESDMIVSPLWIKYMSKILQEMPSIVLTPLHLTDHLMPKLQRKKVNNTLKNNNLWLPRKKCDLVLKIDKLNVFKCYGTIGTFAFGSSFNKKLIENSDRITNFEGAEDAFVSFLANENLAYIVPGQSRIHHSVGLHGDMSSSIASFENLLIHQLIIKTLLRTLKIHLRQIQKPVEVFLKMALIKIKKL